MDAELLIRAGGVFALAFAAFHLCFWKVFRWESELARLSSLNRAIVQVLNLCLTFVFLVFAWVSWRHAGALLGEGLGRTLAWSIAAFWYLRAAEQVVFFGTRKPVSIVFLLLFLLGGSLYAVALAS